MSQLVRVELYEEKEMDMREGHHFICFNGNQTGLDSDDTVFKINKHTQVLCTNHVV